MHQPRRLRNAGLVHALPGVNFFQPIVHPTPIALSEIERPRPDARGFVDLLSGFESALSSL
jgi:hypothetical protein